MVFKVGATVFCRKKMGVGEGGDQLGKENTRTN